MLFSKDEWRGPLLVSHTAWEHSASPDGGHEWQDRESQTLGRREAVMGYDEKEEIEATGEWLLRIKKVGFSEELQYVPSRLAKMGVAPIDVVDQLDRLRDASAKASATAELFAERRMSPVLVLERPVAVIEAELVSEPVVLEEEPEPLMIEGSEAQNIPLDYDVYGPWKWLGEVEDMIEHSIKSVLDPEPGLLLFNELSLSMRRRKGRRKVRVLSQR